MTMWLDMNEDDDCCTRKIKALRYSGYRGTLMNNASPFATKAVKLPSKLLVLLAETIKVDMT